MTDSTTPEATPQAAKSAATLEFNYTDGWSDAGGDVRPQVAQRFAQWIGRCGSDPWVAVEVALWHAATLDDAARRAAWAEIQKAVGTDELPGELADKPTPPSRDATLSALVDRLPRSERLYVLQTIAGFAWAGCTAPKAAESLKEATEDLAAGLAKDRIRPDDALFTLYAAFMRGDR